MDSIKRVLSFVLDNLLSVLTIVFGFIVGLIASLNHLTMEQTILLILWLLVSMATSELYDRSRRLRYIEKKIDRGFKTVIARGDVEVVLLSSHNRGYEYMADKISKAERRIRHAGLAPTLRREGIEYHAYEKAIDDAVTRGVQYSYISIPRDSARLDRIKRLRGKTNFHYGCYEYKPEFPPIPSFMIVDSKVLILNLPKRGLEDDVCLAIIHGDLVERFEEYFYALEEKCKVNC